MKTCPACALVFPDESTFCFLSGHTLEPTPDPLVGTSIDGRFLVEALLSETAWSKLYAARYRLMMVACCVKVFPQPLDEAARQRFNEALKCARRFSHDNLSEVIGGGVLPDGTAYIAHPRDNARPLSVSLMKGSMDVSMALGVARQILLGLGRIHDFGGTHGSLRPSNVMMLPSGHVELVHSGLGRVLVRDVWEDNPRALPAQLYLAPELSSQERQSVAADLYALGGLTVHMLSGAPPHPAENVAELLGRLRGDAASEWQQAVASVPEPIMEWLRQLLATAPRRRPATAHQALAELQDACEAAGILPVADPGPAAPLPKAPMDKIFDRWNTFDEVFGEMVKIGFPSGAPPATDNSLQAIKGRVQQLQEMANKARYEHDTLVDVMVRAREGRERIAAQMAELNTTAKQIRKDLQPLKDTDDGESDGRDYAGEARALHREVVRWEGRSGFTEPYQELAEAYRMLAVLLDEWFEVRSGQLQLEQNAAETQEKLIELDSQLEELRDALRIHESNLGAEVQACENTLGELGNKASELEAELIDLASRFSAPLRAKPELGNSFRKLEKSI